jgi:hypothetical protein
MAGNANSGRKQEKPFRDALRMELAAAGEDGKRLRNVARKVLELAEQGEQWAVRELADRIDGKVPTPIAGDDENPLNIVARIERVIVRPS